MIRRVAMPTLILAIIFLLLTVPAQAVSYTQTNFVTPPQWDTLFGPPNIQSTTQLGDSLFVVLTFPWMDVELWEWRDGSIGFTGVGFDCCGIHVYWSDFGLTASIFDFFAVCEELYGCTWQSGDPPPAIAPPPPPSHFFDIAIINNDVHVIRFDPVSAPEPSTWLLLASGLVVLVFPSVRRDPSWILKYQKLLQD